MKVIEGVELPVDLTISVKKVCHVIALAREVGEEELIQDPNRLESEVVQDEADADALTEPDSELLSELKGFVDNLTLDEQIDLVALMWLGRDDGSWDNWHEIRAEAAEAHNAHSAEYLCGNPLLADHLAEGLSLLGASCEDEERNVHGQDVDQEQGR